MVAAKRFRSCVSDKDEVLSAWSSLLSNFYQHLPLLLKLSHKALTVKSSSFVFSFLFANDVVTVFISHVTAYHQHNKVGLEHQQHDSTIYVIVCSFVQQRHLIRATSVVVWQQHIDTDWVWTTCDPGDHSQVVILLGLLEQIIDCVRRLYILFLGM